MISFDSMDDALRSLGKDRNWLAAAADYSEPAVREALAPNSKKRSTRLQAALSAAIEKERAQQEASKFLNSSQPQTFSLTVTKEQFEIYEKAALAEGKTLTQWIIDTTDEQAAIAAKAKIRALEDPPDSQNALRKI